MRNKPPLLNVTVEVDARKFTRAVENASIHMWRASMELRARSRRTHPIGSLLFAGVNLQKFN